MQLNLLKVNQANFSINYNYGNGENIMIILSSPSGVGKTTLTKKFNKKSII